MPNENISQDRVRVIRDLMLHYLYHHGGEGKLKQKVAIDQLKKTLSLNDAEFLAGLNNLQARRLVQYPGTPNHVGINIDGQFEVETMGSPGDQASRDAAKLRELSKRLSAQSEVQDKLQAELDAYRLAPWWRRLFAAFRSLQAPRL